MKLAHFNGITGVVVRVKLLDTSSTSGAGKTGLTHSSTGGIVSVIADNEATATAYTVSAGNLETITTLGTYAAPTSGKCRFKEVDSTNHPGLYEIHLANDRWSVSNARSIIISVSGFSGAAPVDAEYQLTTVPADATHWGGTAVASANVLIDGAITDAKIASNAITDAKVASDVTIAIASQVRTELTTELSRIDAAISTRSTLDAAGVRTAIGLASANLDTQLTLIDDYLDTELAAVKVITDRLGGMIVLDGSVYQFTTNALENGPSGGTGGAVQINPIAITSPGPSETPVLDIHVGENCEKGFLFYRIDANGQRQAEDFSAYTALRLNVALTSGTVTIEDITVSDNMLTFAVGSLSVAVGSYEATLWEWTGDGDLDTRSVVACALLVVSDAVA